MSKWVKLFEIISGQRGKLKRIGRTINLAKGIIYQTGYKEGHGGQSMPFTGLQNQPETIAAIPGYDASAIDAVHIIGEISYNGADVRLNFFHIGNFQSRSVCAEVRKIV